MCCLTIQLLKQRCIPEYLNAHWVMNLREITDFNLRIIRNTGINCVVIIQSGVILKQVVRTLSMMF
jgi:hypothetical protein